jgi:hypothetical protein
MSDSGKFAVCWRLQLFCKAGFCVLALCALQMCCNVRWAVRDFALNVVSLEVSRVLVLGLRTTVKHWRWQGI